MDNKILVAFASAYGSTEEIARAIARDLDDQGFAVDVSRARDVDDLSPYRAVILGSAIRGQSVLPEAVRFVEDHQVELRHRPVAYFAVCLTLRADTEENRRQVASWLEPLCRLVPPVEIGLFAGALDPDRMPFVMRVLTRLARMPEGDFRDWPAIHAWAARVGARLAPTGSAPGQRGA